VFEQEIGEQLPDFDKWSTAGKMDRSDAEEQLERWKKSSL
jgi:hypothetical protein